MRRHRSPFSFSGLLPLLCSAQGIPGEGGGGTAPVLAAPVAGAPTALPAAPTVPNVGEPNWLPERIAQAKNSAAAEERARVLAELGVKSPAEAKAAIDAKKAADDASKSAETRAAELKTQLDAETAKGTAQGAIIAEMAGRQMGVLTAEQSTAVKAIAGDDPGAQMRAIAALQPTWAKPAAVAAATATAATTVTPAAADTAPGHTAPNGAGGSPPNQRAAYDQLQKTNPFAAAEHGLRHSGDVYKPRT